MASIFGQSFKGQDGKEQNVIYGTVFQPKVFGSTGGERISCNLSVSAGKDQDGKTKYESWNLSLKADEAAKALKEKDRIKITRWGLSSTYSKEKGNRVYLNAFDWEKAEAYQNSNQQSAPTPTPAPDASESAPAQNPFEGNNAGNPFEGNNAGNPFEGNPFAGGPDFND